MFVILILTERKEVYSRMIDYEKIGEKIRLVREAQGLSQDRLGEMIGFSGGAILGWEKGRRKISLDDLYRVSKALNKSLGFFIGEEYKKSPPDLSSFRRQASKYLDDLLDVVYLPVIGTIAAGLPILAEQNISDYLPFPKFIANRASLALKVKGDSMVGKGIEDGDYVFIQLQNEIENGKIAAVIVNGAAEAEATLKMYFDEGNGKIRLKSANEKYKDIIADKKDIRIVGKYAGLFKAPE
jgi:repressor LexA